MSEKLNRRKEDSTGPGVPEVQGPENRSVPSSEAHINVALIQEEKVNPKLSRGPIVSRSPQERQVQSTSRISGIQQRIQLFLEFVYNNVVGDMTLKTFEGQGQPLESRMTGLSFLGIFLRKNPPAVPVTA